MPHLKITVVGASGLIGTKVVSSGVDVLIGVPDALIQPIRADQVASAVARAAVAEPVNGIVNVGGPHKITFEQLARDALARKGDHTKIIVVDPATRYFGALLGARSLVTPD